MAFCRNRAGNSLETRKYFIFTKIQLKTMTLMCQKFAHLLLQIYFKSCYFFMLNCRCNLSRWNRKYRVEDMLVLSVCSPSCKEIVLISLSHFVSISRSTYYMHLILIKCFFQLVEISLTLSFYFGGKYVRKYCIYSLWNHCLKFTKNGIFKISTE